MIGTHPNTSASEDAVPGDFASEGAATDASKAPLIVTIAREYGSGGREIGKKLAERLDVAYYDKVLLNKIADKSGLANDVVEAFDESMLGLSFFSPSRFFAGSFVETLSGRIHEAEVDLIRSLAEEKPCVMVGRCIDSLLEGRPNVVRLFVSAPMESRLTRVMERNDLGEEEARERIAHVDKERSSYYRYMSDKKWGYAANYDLCINSEIAGIDGAVAIIEHFLKATGKVE